MGQQKKVQKVQGTMAVQTPNGVSVKLSLTTFDMLTVVEIIAWIEIISTQNVESAAPTPTTTTSRFYLIPEIQTG